MAQNNEELVPYRVAVSQHSSDSSLSTAPIPVQDNVANVLESRGNPLSGRDPRPASQSVLLESPDHSVRERNQDLGPPGGRESGGGQSQTTGCGPACATVSRAASDPQHYARRGRSALASQASDTPVVNAVHMPVVAIAHVLAPAPGATEPEATSQTGQDALEQATVTTTSAATGTVAESATQTVAESAESATQTVAESAESATQTVAETSEKSATAVTATESAPQTAVKAVVEKSRVPVTIVDAATVVEAAREAAGETAAATVRKTLAGTSVETPSLDVSTTTAKEALPPPTSKAEDLVAAHLGGNGGIEVEVYLQHEQRSTSRPSDQRQAVINPADMAINSLPDVAVQPAWDDPSIEATPSDDEQRKRSPRIGSLYNLPESPTGASAVRSGRPSWLRRMFCSCAGRNSISGSMESLHYKPHI